MFNFENGMLNIKHVMSEEDTKAVLDFVEYIKVEERERILNEIEPLFDKIKKIITSEQ